MPAILTLTRIRDLLDFGSTPGAGNDLYVVAWDNAADEFILIEQAAGVTDHGELDGLGDDDHTLYLLASGARNTTGSHTLSAGANLTLAGGELTITEDVATNVPLTINLAAGQSANAIEVKNSGGTTLASVSPDGSLVLPGGGYGSPALSAGNFRLHQGDGNNIAIGGVDYLRLKSASSLSAIMPVVALMAPLASGTVRVRGHSGQSGDLQTWAAFDTTAAGTTVCAIGPTGQIKTNQTAANTNTPSGATAAQLPIYDEAGTLVGYVPIYASAW